MKDVIHGGAMKYPSAARLAEAILGAAGASRQTVQPEIVRKEALREFLVHGLRYVFPAEWSGVTRGVPTSYAAPPLKAQFAEGDMPPVWPHPEGTARGEGLAPLYKSAPRAALRDPLLYEWLALVDAVRAGRARERKLATKEIERRLSA